MSTVPARAVAFVTLLSVVASAQSPPLAALPLEFETNLGQTDPVWTHVARAPGYTVFASRDGFTVRLAGAAAARGSRPWRVVSIVGC